MTFLSLNHEHLGWQFSFLGKVPDKSACVVAVVGTTKERGECAVFVFNL